jgi:CDP-diacylglycerol---glycerol-3-phosphate 3-phosphatidyltransferase
MKFVDACRKLVRSVMKSVARGLNKATNGEVTPNTITLIGLFTHLPIAWLIADQQNILAGVLLIVFGLLDTLDGELARLQGTSSMAGMLLDSATDRMKEVLLYCGVGFALVAQGKPYYAVWAVAACGASIVVSYVNAWGEVVLSKHGHGKHAVNKAFRGGLLSFEIRIFLLVVGLFANQLAVAVVVIAILSAFTALQRLGNVKQHLEDVQD